MRSPVGGTPVLGDGWTARAAGAAGDATTDGIGALAAVLATYEAPRLVGHGERRDSDRALRAVAGRLATEARARDSVRAERLVIELRRAWLALPELALVPQGALRGALWDRLVRLCCEEFYAPAATLAGAPAPATRLSLS